MIENKTQNRILKLTNWLGIITIVFLIISAYIHNTKNYNTIELRNDFSYSELAEAYKCRKDTLPYNGSMKLMKVEFDTLHCALFDEHLEQKVIYGQDNRQDIYEVNDCDILDNSNGVAALFFSSSFISDGSDSLILVSGMYGIRNSLCESERYYEQPSAAFCTGFLIDNPKLSNGTNYVATAGHCIDGMNINNLRVVFGFKYSSENNVKVKYHKDEVYSIEKIVTTEHNQFRDYALIKINKVLPKKQSVDVQRFSERITDEVYVLGHPAGIPQKLATQATVQDIYTEFFSSNLDTYGGNSGSPVFDRVNHKVVGILVRGETDFIQAFEQNCRVSKICQISNCAGEDVNFIDPIIRKIELLN